MGFFSKIFKEIDKATKWIDRSINGSSGGGGSNLSAIPSSITVSTDNTENEAATIRRLENELSAINNRRATLITESTALTVFASTSSTSVALLTTELVNLNKLITSEKTATIDMENSIITNIDNIFDMISSYPAKIKAHLCFYFIKNINEFDSKNPEYGIAPDISFDKYHMLSLIVKSSKFQESMSLVSYDYENKESLASYIAKINMPILTKEVLSKITDINERDITGHNYFHYLILQFNKPSISEAVKAGVNLNVNFPDDKSITYKAIQYTDLEIINMLLSNGSPAEPLLLHAAAFSPRTETFDWAMSKSAGRYDLQDEKGNTPFIIAALNGRAHAVDELLSVHANLNIANNDGVTPLLAEGKINCLGFVKEFISHGANPLACDLEGNNILHYFVQNIGCTIRISENTFIPFGMPSYSYFQLLKKCSVFIPSGGMVSEVGSYYFSLNGVSLSPQIINHPYNIEELKSNNFSYQYAINAYLYLKDHRLDINKSNNNGLTPLMIACDRKLYYFANYIIDNFLIDYTIVDKNGYSVLHHAIDLHDPSLIEKLVAKGANINAQDKIGSTILHRATLYNDIPTVNKLVQLGINLDIRGEEGWFPIHIAARNNFVELLNILSPLYGVDRSTELKGYTPLMLACQSENPNAVKFLLEHGANVNAITTICNNESSLIYATVSGNIEAIKLLLDYRADIDHANSAGITALYFALMHDKNSAARLLIEKGANVNKPMNDGDTPLHMAAYHANIEAFEMLISAHADINKVNDQRMTALHVLASYIKNTNTENKISCIKLLLAANIDINIVDATGKKAIDYIREFLPEAIVLVDPAIPISTISEAEIDLHDHILISDKSLLSAENHFLLTNLGNALNLISAEETFQ